ncbi:hypothetical protein [Leptotrichia shahii]|uniref:hypothetical protein n=1 Tax=Leptotrichia shahii TaxID=157691 RepID=UPI0028D2DB74|nr:hypothetical protein [Leptotrichia shahii]
MKKIILSLFVLLSLSSFTQEKYQVEVEPAVKLNQSILLDYNSQIEKEVSRIYSKEEMFGMMNKMMNGFSATSDIKNDKNQMKELMESFFGEDYFSKMLDTMYKYYKIDIEKIDYINENKAYVKVKLGFPVNTDEMSIDKIFERSGEMMDKMDKAFKKKTGKTMEEYSKSISENDEKAMKKYFKIASEIQIEMMDQELERITKNGKYVGRKEILEANKKNGKWVIENPNFGY